jgi:hypothetical protein
MKLYCFLLVLHFFVISCLGQEDSTLLENLDWSIPKPFPKVVLEEDLTTHFYWREYLLRNGMASLVDDSAITEAYRLTYWGQYFSIVEIVKRSDHYFITADSSAWGMTFNKIFRMQDSMNTNGDIEFIKQYCISHKDVKRLQEAEEDSWWENVEDDRDNWAFEYRIDSIYRSRHEIEVPEELVSVYERMMKLGNLTGYVIYVD